MQLFVRLVGATLCAAALTVCTEPFYCTPDAVVWRVTVLDADGAPVTDLHWTAVIASTQDTISHATLAALSAPESGTYAIFTNDRRTPIDPTGDVVRVEGASGLDWFSAEFVFDVPDADCYANRVSGPDTVTLAPAPFAIVNGDRVWGGGDILVASPVFRLVDDSLPFLVDADTVWSQARAGDTAAVEAPVNSGAYVVAVLRGEAAESLATAAVRGYGGFGEGPPMTGVLMRWPPNTPNPTFLASGPNQLQLFDAATRTVVRSYPDSIHNPYTPNDVDGCPQGIGPTYEENAVVLCSRPGTVWAWNIEGEPRPIDVPQSDAAWGARMAALVAPGRWLIGRHHQIDSPSGGVYYRIEEPQVMQISPRGDRVAIVGNAQPEGVVVLDSTLALAYRIEDLTVGCTWRVGGGFSTDGGVLFAAVQCRDTMQVAAVAAEDGAMLAFREMTALRGPADLLVDQQGAYVFVIGAPTYYDRRSVFRVLDAQSLELVAEIELPEMTCQTYPPDYSPVGLVQDQTEKRVYAVWGSGEWQFEAPTGSCIERFDLW